MEDNNVNRSKPYAYEITGGTPLRGDIDISGSKNAALGIIAASVMVDGPCTLENVPDISDVKVMFDLCRSLGAKVDEIDTHTFRIDPTTINTYKASGPLVSKIRASYYLMGALLARCGKASIRLPGGCDFGQRPIDLHLKAFQLMGAKGARPSEINSGIVNLVAEPLHGAKVYLDIVSVGATINAMLAACKAEGRTEIINAAKEPHIVDVANFLNSMGAHIKGAGTDTIKITGVPFLPGNFTYSIIPDQIEAGTYMIAAAVTKGDVTIHNLIPTHMEPLSAKMREMGYQIEEGDESIRVYLNDPNDEIYSTSVKTSPYPGFPTDLQPQTVVLLCSADGQSRMHENVWQNRFQYVPELAKMGANINVYERIAWVNGTTRFMGATVEATDLRAGAALVCAALAADGVSHINHANRIDRGYEHIVQKLTALGASIRRVNIEEYSEEDTEA
ncbi:MAG: UDP-N-acetylglucosamine 1-carboxyvinyltransferase [Clostridiales bacterium]|nr:UDP-N-acetylglucosamine 1-carboxyvinyltransferase [Clostridiales bacterium]MBR6487624.1 UDP-N-acetylglucosamine 1-carboxyvinyltransferase [Clostridiales bacterium]